LTLVVVACGVSQTAYADDVTARQETVKQQLIAAAAQITQLDSQMARLASSMADTQARVGRERAQVKRLARALYAQPDSLIGALFESTSIADALTRIGDLNSAGDRAAATKHALDRDLSKLTYQRTQLQSDRDRKEQLKKQLEDQYSKLVTQALASRAPTPSPSQSPSPSSSPVPSPGPPIANPTAIQQIILDAFAPLGAGAQQWALRVAKCESNYNPLAVNPSSGASGLFQFLPSTWALTPQHAQSVFDAVANAQAAAWLYQRSGPGQWSCK
jgi:Transglycosylase SLT domain